MGKNKAFKLFNNKRIRKIAMLLAIVVVFTTTYALILPAISLDGDRADEDPAVFIEPAEELVGESSLTELTATVEALAPETVQETAAETPVEETPAVESTEETPAVETPAVEQPAAETPAQETPAAETSAVEGTAVKKASSENRNANKAKHAVGPFLVEEVLGDLTVTADAEAGVLPEGSRMELRSVKDLRYIDAVSTAVSGEMQNARFVDIRFIDPNGVEVDPAGPVHFSFRNYLLGDETVGTVVYVNDEELYSEEIAEEEARLYGLIVDPAEEWNYIDEVTFWSDSVGTYGLVVTNRPEEAPAEEAVEAGITASPAPEASAAREGAEDLVDEEALEEKMPAQHLEMVS